MGIDIGDYGRRYLRFDLSRSGDPDCFLAEWGGVQTTVQPIEVMETLVVLIEQTPDRLQQAYSEGETKSDAQASAI